MPRCLKPFANEKGKENLSTNYLIELTRTSIFRHVERSRDISQSFVKLSL